MLFLSGVRKRALREWPSRSPVPNACGQKKSLCLFRTFGSIPRLVYKGTCLSGSYWRRQARSLGRGKYTPSRRPRELLAPWAAMHLDHHPRTRAFYSPEPQHSYHGLERDLGRATDQLRHRRQPSYSYVYAPRDLTSPPTPRPPTPRPPTPTATYSPIPRHLPPAPLPQAHLIPAELRQLDNRHGNHAEVGDAVYNRATHRPRLSTPPRSGWTKLVCSRRYGNLRRSIVEQNARIARRPPQTAPKKVRFAGSEELAKSLGCLCLGGVGE